MTNRQVFLQHLAQTSGAPMGLEITHASGIYLSNETGSTWIDGISGFSVMNLGHGHPAIKEAIHAQIENHMHLMVYGEIIQTPQVAYAQKLCAELPPKLDCVYFTNSGAEAVEGAMKLAKRVTGRTRILAFKNSYHGSTQGALSIMGDEYWRNAYRPLLPDVYHLDFNDPDALEAIDINCACLVMEVVQAEAGVILPTAAWLRAIRQKCTDKGVLLVFDEIQTGFGRTGTLWAFEKYGVIPDILLLGKALGGGLPLGAFIASQERMQTLTHQPVLGHISTFAGHPVCCAAGLAAFKILLNEFYTEGTHDSIVSSPNEATVAQKAEYLCSLLVHPAIKEVRYAGLLIAIELENAETCLKVCEACIAAGLVTDWFLFAPNCLRIAPPLVISEAEMKRLADIILRSLDLFGIFKNP